MMTVNRIASLALLLVGGMLLAVGLFAVLVPMDFSVSAPGRVMPARTLAVSFPDDGRLAYVFPATTFKRGDTLATLDSSREELELSACAQERQALEAELLNPLERPVRFALKSRLLALDARQGLLRQDLERKLFRAPFDGEILSRAGRVGEVARKGEPVLLAADLERVFVVAVNQDHRDEFQPGTEAKIYLDNFAFQEYGLVDATLVEIQTDLSAPAARYTLKLKMRNAFRDFEPGLTGRAELKVFRGALGAYFMRK